MAKKIYTEILTGNNTKKADPIIQDESLGIPDGFEDSTNIITVATHECISDCMEYDAQRNWVKALFLARDTESEVASEAVAFPLLTTAEQYSEEQDKQLLLKLQFLILPTSWVLQQNPS